jgi:hypothetical protein
VNWIAILVGVALLTVGRKLFWVFAGGAGFVAGMWLTQAFFPEQPQNTVLIAGVIGAVAGIALTQFVKTIAINIGGFLGGGVIGLGLARMIGPWLPEWLAFIVLGILGVVLLKMAFETALLLISSIAGAMLIAANLPLSDPLHVVAIVVLSIAGILIQRKVKEGGSTQKE